MAEGPPLRGRAPFTGNSFSPGENLVFSLAAGPRLLPQLLQGPPPVTSRQAVKELVQRLLGPRDQLYQYERADRRPVEFGLASGRAGAIAMALAPPTLPWPASHDTSQGCRQLTSLAQPLPPAGWVALDQPDTLRNTDGWSKAPLLETPIQQPCAEVA